MAASDEFPRQWDAPLGQVSPTLTPTIVIPAFPGISHVLIGISAYILATSNLTGAYTAGILVNTVNVGWFGFLNGAAPGLVEAFTWTGKISCPLNTPLTVTYSQPLATSVFGTLEIQGYDF